MKIKTLLFALLLSIPETETNAQAVSKSPKVECDTCNVDCMCERFFGEYRTDTNQSKIEAIKNNWTDFFGENLETALPATEHVATISIKFDGMGCVYPDQNLTVPDIKNEFLDTLLNHKIFHQQTFYNVYNKYQKGTNRTTLTTNFINSTLPGTQFGMVKNNIEYFDFIRKWNEKFIKQKVNEINGKIENQEIKRIILYIHGFNVPYALAQLQGNIILDSVLHTDKTIQAENLLFVRIFWPSGNFKRKDIGPNTCNYSNIENLKTVSAYTYFSNRAYLSGIYLRRILSTIAAPAIPIDIITHSHGATVATTALINTTSKLQRGSISKDIRCAMVHESLPDRNVNLFLNAPSIPGVSTFVDLEENSVQSNYYFFVGYNNNDITLLKQKIKRIPKFKLPTRLSSTTLGCNRDNEVHNTEQVFIDKKMKDNFASAVNSVQCEHDFFCYIQQKEFRTNLKLFLKRTYE